MQRLIIYAVSALVVAALTWWLVAAPRIELAQTQLDNAQQQLTAAGLLDQERVAIIEAQSQQLAGVLAAELKNRELLQALANQSRAQSQALEELKRNDETIAEYLRAPVPASLGRLYQRGATTNPSAYRQQTEVRADSVPVAGAPGTGKQ
ncbi:MAG: hypothetical protein RBR82_15805 [Pseudomonas sp.]|nr:hypothetical protein [Pseudomonas sp.]